MKCEVKNCGESVNQPLYWRGLRVCRKCYEELMASEGK